MMVQTMNKWGVIWRHFRIFLFLLLLSCVSVPNLVKKYSVNQAELGNKISFS